MRNQETLQFLFCQFLLFWDVDRLAGVAVGVARGLAAGGGGAGG